MSRLVLAGASAFALLLAVPSVVPIHVGLFGPVIAFAQEEGHGGGGHSGGGG